MKKGISIRILDYEEVFNPMNLEIVEIKKEKGELTIEDVEEALRSQRWGEGQWVIKLDIKGDNGYQGWGEEPPGDSVLVYQIQEGCCCPVCYKEETE